MGKKQPHPAQALELEQHRPRAGEVRQFTGGQAVFLAPLPLPTGRQLMDSRAVILGFNDVYLDLGASDRTAFANQVLLGAPFMFGVLMVGILFPIIAGLTVGMGLPEGFWGIFWEAFQFIFPVGVLAGTGTFLLFLYFFFQRIRNKRRHPPLRFNRQRREVCYVEEKTGKPLIVPWEQVAAWVAASTGATQYGVMQQVNLGIGIEDPDTGRVHALLLGYTVSEEATGLWEAIRHFMEFGPDSLAHLPRGGPGAPDDPRTQLPYDGVHTFELLRERLHADYRAGDRGPVYVFFWYLWHLLTFWTLPFKLSEWEYRQSRAEFPAEVQAWSQPLPEDEWAPPSEAYQQAIERLRTEHQRHPDLSFTQLCDRVYGQPESPPQRRLSNWERARRRRAARARAERD